MMMTEGEICRSYQSAKDQQRQIDILAEINLCRKTKIKRILERNGIIKVDKELMDKRYEDRLRRRLQDMDLEELEQEQHRHLISIRVTNEYIRQKGAELLHE